MEGEICQQSLQNANKLFCAVNLKGFGSEIYFRNCQHFACERLHPILFGREISPKHIVIGVVCALHRKILLHTYAHEGQCRIGLLLFVFAFFLSAKKTVTPRTVSSPALPLSSSRSSSHIDIQ